MYLEVDNVSESYEQVLKTLMSVGTITSPRGMKTTEITPFMIKAHNVHKRVIVRKNLNLAFQLREFSDIFNGTNPGHVVRYNSKIAEFLNPMGYFDGHYGTRIRYSYGHDQIKRVIMQLKKDPDTRQAIIMIHSPLFDKYSDSKDIACTLEVHALLRNNKLNFITHLRSNDVWRGYCYDVVNFQTLQEIMSGMLGVKVGTYTHIANSFHAYETNWDDIKNYATPKIYEKYSYARCDNLNELEFNKIWMQKEQAEELARNSKYREALKIAKDIAHPYYQSWAGIMVFYEALKFGKNRQIAEEALSIVSNEFRYWGEQKLENSKNSSKD